MTIIFDGNNVFVDIDNHTMHVCPIYGASDKQLSNELIRMNVHFWLLRNGFSDDDDNGYYISSNCPLLRR